jgi:Na+/H+ antiporter NhaD/arsenite permease-like protein
MKMRGMTAAEIIAVALGIFLATYLIIMLEKLHRAIAALLGAALMCLLRAQDGSAISFTYIITRYISWSTVFLVIGMMIIVSIAGRSGVFQFIALKLVKVTKGDPQTLFFMLLVLTFAISFALDTITTMLVIAPLTIEVYKALEYDYRGILIGEALAADFSSIGSLVGSIENIIIGEQANLTFLDFFLNLQPLAFLFLIFSVPVFYVLNRDQFKREQRVGIEGILLIDESSVIEDQRMFLSSSITMITVLLGFLLCQFTPLEPAIVALTGASFLLAFSGDAPERTFHDIEWNVIFFLTGIFILIGGLEILGIIDEIAETIQPTLKEYPLLGIAIVIWFSALLSAIVDNIPVTATLAAIFAKMEIRGIHGKFLYLALIVGVNVGGNLSPIGSPANVIALSLSEREKKRITISQFMKTGVLISTIHLIIGTLYLWLLYLLVA